MRKIESTPWRFDFFQLVRLLETGHTKGAMSEVGHFTPASSETIKFVSNPQLNFEPAPVKSVKLSADGSHMKIQSNFWGLNGNSGTLPFHYSELIIQRIRNNDQALRDFLDIFNHRSLSLFYKAWLKHRPWLRQASKDQPYSKFNVNRHEALLKGLTGLATQAEASFNKPQGAWLNYAGFAASRICSAASLKQAIEHHFGLKIRINEFKGQWETLPADVRTQLGNRRSPGINNRLGMNSLLGRRCWNAQNRFEVEVIDIEYAQFMTLSPGSEKLHALYQIIKYKVGTELDFDLTLKVQKNKLLPARCSAKMPSQLGWNSRLKARSEARINHQDIIKISVSRHGMHRLANDQKTAG
jgi:type VI secretion system protein ImpH